MRTRSQTPATFGLSLKSKLRSSIAVNEAYFVLKNLGARWRQTSRKVSLSREFMTSADPAARAEHAKDQFGMYQSLGGLDATSVTGRRVLEVGPGESLGAAFLFAAHGADVATLDAFRVKRSEHADIATAALLMKKMGHEAKAASAILDRIDTRYGIPLERASDAFAPESFDLIVSNAVLEHTRDVQAALRQADALLRPGGCQIHNVGLGDHGVFTPGGIHELAFLGVSDFLWRLMTEHLALPNRSRVSTYREVLTSLDYTTTWSVTGILGVDPLEPALALDGLLALPMRPETAKALSLLPAKSREFLEGAPIEDWLVQAFHVTCWKPGRFSARMVLSSVDRSDWGVA
jgi:SAM-dependent methyltransferase